MPTKEDLCDASTHCFLMTVRPRQHTEVQIPDTDSPGRESGLRALLLMLIRSRRAQTAQERIQMPEPPSPHSQDASGQRPMEPLMLPNPAPPPTSPAMGSKFHYISQEGSSFFLSEHLASETS